MSDYRECPDCEKALKRGQCPECGWKPGAEPPERIAEWMPPREPAPWNNCQDQVQTFLAQLTAGMTLPPSAPRPPAPAPPPRYCRRCGDPAPALYAEAICTACWFSEQKTHVSNAP